MRAAAALTIVGVLQLGTGGAASAAEPTDITIVAGSAPLLVSNAKKNGGAERVERIAATFDRQNFSVVYCLNVTLRVDPSSPHAESGWADTGAPNLGKVLWILNHSYPKVPAETVLEAAHAEALPVHGPIMTVYAATQVAIWQLADPENFQYPDQPASGDDRLKTIVDYLLNNATEQAEPAFQQLSVTPATHSGASGTKVGPYRVPTTIAGQAELRVIEGDGKIVDEQGGELNRAGNGDVFYLTSNRTGVVRASLEAKATIPVGRTLARKANPGGSQRLILATELAKPVSAQAEARFEATLPVTGASIGVLLAVAAGSVAAGMALIHLARRRRMAV
ncbi:MAG TPA: thioester domain-containing protein [Candidatus Limnocylindrales bacterium]